MLLYDITAPLCINHVGEAEIPKPKSAVFSLSVVGHDLQLSGIKTFKYLSNVVEMNFHVGTHLDTPMTFAYNSSNPLEISTSFFLREAVIADVRSQKDGEASELKPIKLKDIKEKIDVSLFTGRVEEEKPALLIRTGMSRHWCRDNAKYLRFPGLSKEAVEYIAYTLKPFLVGIDAVSIDRSVEYRSMNIYPKVDKEFINAVEDQKYTPFLNHDILLRRGIYILENLYMNELPQDVNRGLLFIIPMLRLLHNNPSKAVPICAMPCRVFLIYPSPSIEVVLREIDTIEEMLATITRKVRGV